MSNTLDKKLEKDYNHAMIHKISVSCPVCNIPKHYRLVKRHLVEVHGWRYTDESKDFPVKAEGVSNV